MKTLANHMRITGLQVSNDDVNSRTAAIKYLKAAWEKNTLIDKILLKAGYVAAALHGDGTPSEALGKEVEAAIQKKASAFLYTDRPLEVGIVAGMVAAEIMSASPTASGWTIADAWAGALWSALGFQPPLVDERREALRMSVLQAARDRSVAGAEKARQRVDVPAFGSLSLVAGQEGKLGEAVNAATKPTIDALRSNAALDREEIDFLWWAQLRRSRILKRSLDAIDEIPRVISAGIEGAAYLRRMPCEVHREIVLRTIDTNPSVALAGVLESLNTDRENLATQYVGNLTSDVAAIFPLLTALVTGEAGSSPASVMNRNAEEWGARALLEAALLKTRMSGPVNL